MCKIPTTQIFQFAPFEQIPDLFLLGCPLLHLHEDQSFLSDTPNGRKMVARQFNPQHRSLAPRCVDVYDHWQKVKTCFIDKNTGSLLDFSFFEEQATAALSSI